MNVNKDLSTDKYRAGYSIGDFPNGKIPDDNVRDELDSLTKRVSEKKIQSYITNEMAKNQFLSVTDYRRMTNQVIQLRH